MRKAKPDKFGPWHKAEAGSDVWADAFIRAQAGKTRGLQLWEAHNTAWHWCQLAKRFNGKTHRTKELYGDAYCCALMRDIAGQVLLSVAQGDANWFRHFANSLEAGGRPFCRVREWLVKKHTPIFRPDKRRYRLPRFTHSELLADADAKGISISDRQLRRLMGELHFLFKNSRSQ